MDACCCGPGPIDTQAPNANKKSLQGLVILFLQLNQVMLKVVLLG